MVSPASPADVIRLRICRQDFARYARSMKCIQKQLKYHMLARTTLLRGLEFSEKGKRKEAIKAQVDGERYARLYQKYGGKGPIT